MTDSMPTRQVAPLPAPLTSFVGRERDVAHLSSLLRGEVRLVTLTGPGGVGKTRLALRVAHDVQDAFADGVAFVPLAPITDPDLVCSTIAQALGVRERGDRSAPALLAEALRDREMLLILDNFEQIVEAAPQLTEVLAACPRLRLLVTSRILLRLSGEHDVPVRPLSLPDSTSSSRHVGDAEAVHLFVERARAADPTFTLADDNARAVTAICQRLDGLPLALELVAAKVRFLPPHALLPRLAQTLPLLTGGRRDDPIRLQTMRDAIAWSYDLLPAELQTLFTRLSVFAGGFTLEAAMAVAGVPEDTEVNVLSGVESLLEHSLIHRMAHESEPRFGMLETVREFGLDCLSKSDQERHLRAAHAEYFQYLTEEGQTGIIGPAQEQWATRLEADLPNFRAAMDWLEAFDQTEAGLRMATNLGWFWYRRNRDREGTQRLLTYLRAAAMNNALHSAALSTVAELAVRLGEHEKALEWSEQALSISREMGDQRGAATALRNLGNAVTGLGDLERAGAALAESLQMFQELDATWDAAIALNYAGIANYAAERYDAAIINFTQARDLHQITGDRMFRNWMLGNIGWVAMNAHDNERARSAYAESLEVAWDQGDIWWLSWCLMGAGGLASRSGSPHTAARLFGKAEALQSATNAPLRPAVQAKYDILKNSSRTNLSDEAWVDAYAAGGRLSLEQAVEEARQVFALGHSSFAFSPDQPAPFDLTAREVEVLRLVAAGQSNSEIAAALFISVPTVKRHLSTILHKLDLPSRPAAIAYAHTHGLA